jgi:hypothetical protein
LRSTAILVHEREPYWTPELHRQFADEPVSVRGCSSPADLDGFRTKFNAVVIVVDLASSPSAGLTWLTRRGRVDDPVVVLASSDLADLEWTLRGIGIASFRTDPISSRELARQCRQWLVAVTPDR